MYCFLKLFTGFSDFDTCFSKPSYLALNVYFTNYYISIFVADLIREFPRITRWYSERQCNQKLLLIFYKCSLQLFVSWESRSRSTFLPNPTSSTLSGTFASIVHPASKERSESLCTHFGCQCILLPRNEASHCTIPVLTSDALEAISYQIPVIWSQMLFQKSRVLCNRFKRVSVASVILRNFHFLPTTNCSRPVGLVAVWV